MAKNYYVSTHGDTTVWCNSTNGGALENSYPATHCKKNACGVGVVTIEPGRMNDQKMMSTTRKIRTIIATRIADRGHRYLALLYIRSGRFPPSCCLLLFGLIIRWDLETLEVNIGWVWIIYIG